MKDIDWMFEIIILLIGSDEDRVRGPTPTSSTEAKGPSSEICKFSNRIVKWKSL